MARPVTHRGTDWEVQIGWIRRAPWRGWRRKRTQDPRATGRRGRGWIWLPLESFEGVFLAVAAIAFLFFFGLPLLAFVIEQLVFVVLALLAAISRTILRRPWLVEARRSGAPEPAALFEVVGWRRALRARTQVAEHIARTGRPPGALAHD